MSGIHYKNGGYVTTSVKPTLTRSRGGVTTSTNYWVSYNDAKTSIIDRSTSAISVTNGGAVYNAATPYSGTNKGSIYCDATGDYVNATSSNFTFGTGDFTIMTWINVTTLGAYGSLFEGATAGGSRVNSFVWTIYNNGSGGIVTGLFHNGGWLFQSTTVIPANTWTHVALIRNNGVTKFYINGVLNAQTSFNMNVTTNFCQIGKIGDSSGSVMKYAGYNVFKGVGLYTANFTPPSVNEDLGSISIPINVDTSTYGVYKL